MNKKAKRKAFFICLTICLMYISLTVKITERFNMARLSQATNNIKTSGISLSAQAEQTKKQQAIEIPPARDVKETGSAISVTKEVEPDKTLSFKRDDDHIEPGFFMSIPIVCYLIKNRIIEQDVLVPSSGNTWKKPLKILEDRDIEGLKNLSRLVNRKEISDFLKKEGIEHKDDISTEDLITGRGYLVDKVRLRQIYGVYVGDGYDAILPIALNNMMIKKTSKGFEFLLTRQPVFDNRNENKAEKEWTMPSLINLPMRVALERLNVNTSRIKIVGMGSVYDQSPKPHETVKGESECILYGRVNN